MLWMILKKNLSIERHNSYAESVGTWIIAEFATSYDPCTCFHTTGFQIYPVLVSVSTITLTIQGTSISTPLMSGGSISNQNGFIEAIGNINTAFQAVSTLTEKGQKVYKNLNAFENTIGNLVTPTNSSFIGAIPDFLSPIPYIGAGLHVLDFLVGGGKNSSSSTVTSFMERHQYDATGSDTTIAPYQGVWYYTPGSDRTGFDESNRVPVYDNVLGVANVLRTPTVNVYEKEFNHSAYWDYGIGDYVETYDYQIIYQLGDLQYVVNEYAGINPIPETASGYLIFQGCDGPQTDAGLIPTGLPNEWRTPELPLGCLLQYQTIFEGEGTEHGIEGLCGNVKVKLKLILSQDPANPNADEIMFMQTYIANIQPFGEKPDEDNFFEGVKPEEIDGGSINNLDCKFLPPVNVEQIEKFCHDEYDPKTDKSIEIDTPQHIIEEESTSVEIEIFPNPTRSVLTVQHEFENPTYQIVSITGQIVTEGRLNLLEKGIDVSSLASGYYFIKITNAENVSIQKSFVKQ